MKREEVASEDATVQHLRMPDSSARIIQKIRPGAPGFVAVLRR
jgi:hypothetical protein